MISPDSRHKDGMAGEQRVADYLLLNGYSIVARNWRTRNGEIDIIAEKDGVLAFVEVKTLPNSGIETAGHVLGLAKQKRIVETAKCFLNKHRQYSNSIIRFDVAVVDMPCFEPVYHIVNAFSERV